MITVSYVCYIKKLKKYLHRHMDNYINAFLSNSYEYF